jgi:hypothetical protein
VHHPDAARYANMDRERYFVGDYKDTYDGRHYVIAPGYFRTTYGAALHFQKRAVVPGSRNPETNYQASFIAIIGIADVSPSAASRWSGRSTTRPSGRRSPTRSAASTKSPATRSTASRWSNPIEREVTVKSVNEAITGRPATASRVRGGGGPARGRRGTAGGGDRPRNPDADSARGEPRAAGSEGGGRERGSED